MQEHVSAAIEGTLLYAVALSGVLAATLVVIRRLAMDWGRIDDHATPAAHAGMGAVMILVMVTPSARPVLVVAAAVFALVAAVFCGRALCLRRSTSLPARYNYLATAGTAMVMALVFFVGGHGPGLTIALVTSLLICGAIYARSAVQANRGVRTTDVLSEGPYLAMTASMAAMVAVM